MSTIDAAVAVTPRVVTQTPGGRITALIPAHNEESTIGEAIGSLRRQTRSVDELIVIADNCTDLTADIARNLGATVIHTKGNRHKKAGALNQVLRTLLPASHPHDRILVLDADSFLDPTFVDVANEWISRDNFTKYGAIGARFRGRPESVPPGTTRGPLRRLVEWGQCNEYSRYVREIRRRRGRSRVLSGTGTLFSVEALNTLVRARQEDQLHRPSVGEKRRAKTSAHPGPDAYVYDTEVLTEDNEITLALLHLGYQVHCPVGCGLSTEVVPTWGDLYHQRLRWKRGGIENLRQYGLTRITLPYWGQQAWMFLGIIVFLLYFVGLAITLIIGLALRVRWIWIAVLVIAAAERMVTVRERGWRTMALSALLLPEMPYDLFLQFTHVKALFQALRRRETVW